MKKIWKNYDMLRHLEPSNDEFLKKQEEKLNDRDGWTAVTEGPPCGGEVAIPLEEMHHES